jgi:UDP-N-acetylmuramoylalanine--D-glutamate ligase
LDWIGKEILVVGLGKSGVAAARLARQLGAKVTVCDDKPLAETAYAAEVTGWGVAYVPLDEARGADFDVVIQSPGVPLEAPVFADARVTGELEFAAPLLLGRKIGITGSNGKTTVTALLGHILREAEVPVQVGGNIGIPPAAMVNDSRVGQWNVLELSSFQLETVESFVADIAVVLNITPDHLDRHHTMERYIDAKARLVETQGRGQVAVLNAGNAASAGLAGRTRAKVVYFNAPEPGPWVVAEKDGMITVDEQMLMPVEAIPLRGRHNVENVMAAAAAAWLANVSLDAIEGGIRSFPGVEHRIELVRTLDGVTYYNDSKATNVDATEKALDAFAGGVWIILGGKDKQSDYRTLAGRLRAKAKGVLLIGSAAGVIRAQLAGVDGGLPLRDCGTMAEAVAVARAEAASGDTVLLAPACASFDQFQSYEHRGRVFKELVVQLE